jgi:integrase
MGVAAARKQAFAFDPRAASASADAGTFKAVAEKWIQHYVDEKELISKPEIVRHLQRYVYPRWAGTQFFEIRRSTVNELLDAIVERHGAPQADGVLATLRSIMNWYQTRDENYVSPIVKGMRRDQRRPTDRKRDRTLTDDEIRAVWTAAGESPFGGIVKLLLLTAQRREKVITMKRDDISDDGVWTIATERPREKGTGGTLKLPEVALDIIHSQPIIDDNPYVFPGSLRGAGQTSQHHQVRLRSTVGVSGRRSWTPSCRNECRIGPCTICGARHARCSPVVGLATRLPSECWATRSAEFKVCTTDIATLMKKPTHWPGWRRSSTRSSTRPTQPTSCR